MTRRLWLCQLCRPDHPCLLWCEDTPANCIAADEHRLGIVTAYWELYHPRIACFKEYGDPPVAVLRGGRGMTWRYEWRCTECCPENPCVLRSVFDPSRCIVGDPYEDGADAPGWVRGRLL